MKQDLCALLRGNSYPGRGILLGRSADGKKAVIAYFIMGRSENSRNRVFEETEDGIRTRAFDESKMTDPSLIIYHPDVAKILAARMPAFWPPPIATVATGMPEGICTIE